MQQQDQSADSRNFIIHANEFDDKAQRLELQGECKIKNTRLIQFSHLKTGIFFLPLIFSIIGLFLLKYYKSLRAKILYWQANAQTATHLYIKGYGKRQEDIVQIHRQGKSIIFFYKKLKYELLPQLSLPVAINYQRQLKTRLQTNFINAGLTSNQVEERRKLYGKNEHIVDPPQYYEYLYEVMTQPFFFIQYLAAVIYIIEKLSELAILLLGSSVITTSINYILLYISYRKIKEIAERIVSVQVLRDGQLSIIPSNQLVPGDLFVPSEEVFCDSILLRGQIYVNQANLTGQSIPIGKYPIDSYNHWKREDTSKWIYQGSKILTTQHALAMVVHIGYSTKRGRILRKILNRTVTISHLFTTCLYFLCINYAVGVIIYLATMKMRIDNGNLEGIIIFLNFLLIVTQCFPPGCPIYFNLVYSFCLMRLKWNNVLGTEPEKTVESAHLKIMCFDKTGTLTEDKVQVNSIYKFQKNTYRQITSKVDEETGLDFKIFGSCHTVRQFNGQLQGDQIDLKMFMHSSYCLKQSKQQGVCFDVQTKKGFPFNYLSILKVCQYQSKFQSMSVFAYDHQTKKYYVFAKGAPEVIHNNSLTKYQYFDKLLQHVSYGGYRTIAYGYKEVPQSMKQKYLSETREKYLQDINIMGFLVFENKLKGDAYDTIQLLNQSGIQSKIITGDNVYIAIETAIRCGIFTRAEEVIFIEGKDQLSQEQMQQSDIRLKIKLIKFRKEETLIKEDVISFAEYLALEQSIVIDNDFLNFSQNLKMNSKIKVFARISPENKALVIKRLKSQIEKQRKSLSKCQRIMSDQIDKVGMVGDGANDLLAIRQASIGIGIRNCDSSYAASFSIENLKDIDYIVRQAKCGERQIVEIVRFISITSFVSVPLLIIMETQGAYFSSFQLIFGNITKYIILNILLALSKPNTYQTIYKSCSNFLKTENMLVFWGNAILGALGHIAIMIYYRTDPEYRWNYSKITINSGWVTQTSIVPAQYFFYSVHPIVLVFSIYLGEPFKESLHKNCLLITVLILNIAFTILMFGIFPQIQEFFGFYHISYPCLGYIALICVVDCILIILFNALIRCLSFHEKPTSPTVIPTKEQQNIRSEIESSQN